MAQPYVGEIRMFAGNFPPAGWAFCDGALISISENETLFNLIGTTYGGDGESTFAVPDLRGRIPIHQGTGPGLAARTLAEFGGVESVTLTQTQIPAHSHPLLASSGTGNLISPGGAVLANSEGALPYLEDAPTLNMHPGAITPSGGNQPHTNVQPYLCVNFIISLFGIFPSTT
jgi:microcystin-dependent protein